MTAQPRRWQGCGVALRKESVDRNTYGRCVLRIVSKVALRKESVDRNAAWTGALRDMHHVALRKESVDRNTYGRCVLRIVSGRSPQGERG